MRFWFVLGSAVALLGVIAEAYGSHSLRETLGADRWGTFQTAARNHMYHALALLAVSFARAHWGGPLVTMAGWLLLAGILLFSGSLYLLAITEVKAFGVVTGVGGLAFVAGWTSLIVGVLKR